MARKLIVEIIGDASSLEKSYRRAEKGTKTFGRSIERAGRGATVATIGYQGLGRAVGAASGAFLGGAGLAYALKSTVAAAEESQRVLGQVQVAVERSGLSWRQYQQRIEEVSLATANLSGFDDERLLQTFSTLVRRTGDVNRALELNALAADVARGRNIELEQASQLVLKASLGQAGALRRVGIAAEKGASGYQLIDALQRKYAGSAAAYGKTAVGAQDRFRVAVENTQETIGKVLLPGITKLLDKASTWLSNSKNQKKLQEDLNSVVKNATPIFRDAAAAVGLMAAALHKYGDALGVLRRQSEGSHDNPLTGFAEVARLLIDPGYGLGKVIELLDKTGKSAEKTGSFFAGLALNVEAVVGQIQEYITTFQESTNVLDTQHGAGAGGGAYAVINKIVGSPGMTRGQRTAVGLAQAQARGGTAAIVAAVNARLGFVRDTITFAQKLIRQHRGDTAKLAQTLESLFGEEASLEGIITGIQDDAAAKAKAIRDRREEKAKKNAAAAKAALKKARERVADLDAARKALGERTRKAFEDEKKRQRDRRVALQFGLLGLGPGGEERVPIVETLQRRLRQLTGTSVDTGKVHALFGNIRRILKGEFGAVSKDVRAEIDRMLDDIAGKLSDAGPLTKAGAVGGRKLALALSTGLHLSPGELNRFQSNINAQKLTAFTVDNHIHVDGREIGRVATKAQQRDRYRTARQTSGFRG